MILYSSKNSSINNKNKNHKLSKKNVNNGIVFRHFEVKKFTVNTHNSSISNLSTTAISGLNNTSNKPQISMNGVNISNRVIKLAAEFWYQYVDSKSIEQKLVCHYIKYLFIHCIYRYINTVSIAYSVSLYCCYVMLTSSTHYISFLCLMQLSKY